MKLMAKTDARAPRSFTWNEKKKKKYSTDNVSVQRNTYFSSLSIFDSRFSPPVQGKAEGLLFGFTREEEWKE